LGITGWVRNNPDGTVSVWAEGGEGALNAFLSWLKTGPRYANVERVDSRIETATNAYADFEAR
jgi:acylphosphatase